MERRVKPSFAPEFSPGRFHWGSDLTTVDQTDIRGLGTALHDFHPGLPLSIPTQTVFVLSWFMAGLPSGCGSGLQWANPRYTEQPSRSILSRARALRLFRLRNVLRGGPAPSPIPLIPGRSPGLSFLDRSQADDVHAEVAFQLRHPKHGRSRADLHTEFSSRRIFFHVYRPDLYGTTF